MAFAPTSIANRYQLRTRLAAGAYAETWLATDRALDRDVALKLVHPIEVESDLETEQFLREARIAASVSHPNVVAVFDGGATNTQPYLVMEWVDGQSLKEQILSHRRIDTRQTISTVIQLLSGLSAIHHAGIIHRDIKPQNIMVSNTGMVKLTDFGIARLVSDPQSEPDGMTAGSAAYMAPEQAKGRPLTPAADIYATGVVLYEMLTGRLPFTGIDPQDVMKKHISERVARPRKYDPSIPYDLESIVLTALKKDPEDRYQSAAQMRDALGWALRRLPDTAAATVVDSAGDDDGHSRFAIVAASIALAMVVLVGATGLAVRDATTSQVISEDTASATPTAAPTETVELDERAAGEPSWVESTRQANAERFEPDPEDAIGVRGEVSVPLPSDEEREYVNRQAPIAEVTEEDEEEEDPPPVATGGTNDPAAYVAPTPTPQPEPDPDEWDHTMGEDSPSEHGDDQQANPPDNGEQPVDPPPNGDDDGDQNGSETDEDSGLNGSDDDTPASGQQSPEADNGDTDPPANGQEHDDGMPDEDGQDEVEFEDTGDDDDAETLELTTARAPVAIRQG